jgi:hypothetical protein
MRTNIFQQNGQTNGLCQRVMVEKGSTRTADSRINFCSCSSSGVCSFSLLFPQCIVPLTLQHRPQSHLNFFGTETLIKIYQVYHTNRALQSSDWKSNIPVADRAIDSRFCSSLDSYRLTAPQFFRARPASLSTPISSARQFSLKSTQLLQQIISPLLRHWRQKKHTNGWIHAWLILPILK